MRQALALALQDYLGAVVMVSHDRHLLRTVIDEFTLVADGRAKPFDGDLDDYAKWAASNPREAAEKPFKAVKAARTQAGSRKSHSALKTELAKLDKQLVKLHEQQKDIEQQLSAADIYEASNKARLRELLHQQDALKRELDTVETRWLELAESPQLKGSDSTSGK
jgi:ATP-binding cassette subfamily F protein 3